MSKAFEGKFETHITVNLRATSEWGRFHSWCIARGLKCVDIALEQGLTPAQPMLTRYSTGTLQSELQEADELRRVCEAAGFAVVRVKLEVSPWNEDVPRDEVEASVTVERYFEHHIKLLLLAETEHGALKRVVLPHGAHLSRNARRIRDDGQQERFVTQRCYGVGSDEAQACFEELLQTLKTSYYTVIETEQEYVVFDSNSALDYGWLTPRRKT